MSISPYFMGIFGSFTLMHSDVTILKYLIILITYAIYGSILVNIHDPNYHKISLKIISLNKLLQLNKFND